MLQVMMFVLMLFQSGPVTSVADSKSALTSEAPTTYTLGSGDQFVIRAVDVEELDNKPVFIDTRGQYQPSHRWPYSCCRPDTRGT